MTANTSPIFPLTPVTSWSGNLTSATNNYDGTSGVTLLYTAGANGSLVNKISAEAAGSNIASVARVFVNNGSTTGTAGNNALFMQFNLPATTASATTATQHIEIPINNLALPAGYKLYILIATAVSAGWNFAATGGDY